MENSLQTALKKMIENQATSDELELLRQAFSSGQIFIGGNVQNSVIIVGSGNTVELNPEAIERLATVNYLSALHELPQPPADFVGRSKELKKILNSIENKGGATISGLVGMAGIGKTVLGLVVAHNLVNKYSDAQFFIDLRGTSNTTPLTPIDVMRQVVQSFHPTADLRKATEDELSRAYQSSLAKKRAILFLDNAYDASQIMPLRPPSNSLMIVTSRFHFVIPGLQSIELDILNKSEAIHLLKEVCPRLTKKDAQRIAELCANLPIALRIAGSYLQIHTDWSVEEYVTELADNTKRLQALHLDGADVNVIASFEQSCQQLSEDEKHHWSMLSIFPGSFKRDALAAVWNLDVDNARKLAGKLHQYSLLEYDSTTNRYRLHDLLSDFASTKLTSRDKSSAQLRHFRHYRDVWFAAEELYTKGGENIANGLFLFDTEFTHIKTAYQWAKENATKNKNILLILKEIPEHVYLARLRLHSDIQIAWFNASLVAAQKLNDKYNQTKIMGNIGVAYDNLGDVHKAIKYMERALEVAHEIGDRKHQGLWLGNIGIVYVNLGEHHKALGYFNQAYEIASELGDLYNQGFWLGQIGSAHINLGDNQKGVEYLERALEIAREIDDHLHQGYWLGDMGAGYVNLGQNRTGIEYFEQALEIAREIGDRQREGLWLGYIGATYGNLGEHRNAIEYFEQALEIAREIGDRRREGRWLGYIGSTYNDLKEHHKAIEYLGQSLEIAREVGDYQHQGIWLNSIGIAYINLGGYDKATEYLVSGLKISRDVGHQQSECQCLVYFSELYIKMEEKEKAKENLECALALSKSSGFREQEAYSLFNFAKLSRLENNKKSAIQYAQEARKIFEEIESFTVVEVNQFIENLS